MKSKFWQRFDEMFGKMDDMFDELPNYIDEQIGKSEKKGGLFTSKSVSMSTTIQNGKKVEVKTENGKTTIKVNGKEYVEKEKEKK